MFKGFSRICLITTIAATGAIASGTAVAGPIEMFLSSGGDTTSVLVGNTGLPSSVSYPGTGTATLNGWSISSATGGTSYSPYVNSFVGIDLGGYVVTCVGIGGCSSDPLTVVISATGYTTTVGLNSLLLEFSGNVQGGNVTTSAYYDTSDDYFCNAGNTASNDCGSSDLVGSLSLDSSSAGKWITGGPDPIRSYSLTISDTFSAGSGGDPSYSVDTTLTEVPEPGTLALFGAGLIGCALLDASRRRRAARRS